MILYGTRLYGYCDAIPGVGHVATRFAHIWFVPLIPLEGFFVFEEDDDRGVKIPMRGKSVLSAWLRSGFIFGGIGSLVGGIATLGGSVLMGLALIVCAVACFAGFAFSGRLFAKMSDERRAELLADCGLLEAMFQTAQDQSSYDPHTPQPAWSQPPAAPQPAWGQPASAPVAQPQMAQAAFDGQRRY